MQIEEQDSHYLSGQRSWNDASLFSHVSRSVSEDEQQRHEEWDEWSEVRIGDVQDIYKSLPITPVSGQMPQMPPLFSLPTLLTPQVHIAPHPQREGAASGDESLDASAHSRPSSSPPSTPPSPTMVDVVEQAIDRLNDAARRIAAVEQKKEHRSPKASRLSPFRDISGEIKRYSTPMPNAPYSTEDYNTQKLADHLPDIWPWIPDTEENEQDLWANHTDPLVRRRFPDRNETARIEEEDVRRARSEGFHVSLLRRGRATIKAKRLQTLFACLAAVAICILLVDMVLVSLAFIHQHRTIPVVNGPPTLTLSVEGKPSSKVYYTQSVTIHLRHFSPLSKVYITHDVEEPVILGNGTPFARVDNAGAANVTTSINQVDWHPGFHTIDAEDVQTHYTANAVLEIIGAGQTRPSHLIINTTSLDFQAGIQGSNTIQPLTLSNTGNAAITWAASSNASWLVLTPNQGVFSSQETIEVAVQRGTLSPGDYTGTITFSSNVGAPITVTVTMTVSALPVNAGPVLMVTPAVLSFTAQDGNADPTAQELVISNPGTQPLSWSLKDNGLASATDQNSFLNTANEPITNWLDVSSTSGTVVPKATSVLNVNVHSQNLLPGAYIDTLVFSSGSGTLNNTQSVSISLTILPQCGLTLSTGAMSFTSVANSSNSTVQALNLSTMSGCNTVNWQASSSASWLQITPTSGQASTTTSSVISVGVNASSMSAGNYNATITVTDGTNSQSVLVTLSVQPPPPPTAPIMAVSPLSMSFTAIEGQSNPQGQAVVISNTGQSALQWHTQVQLLASSWLGASPTGGVVNSGQTGQVVVTANAAALSPGDYTGQVTIFGTDTNTPPHNASGNPQTIMVQLHVSPPCGLQAPSSSALAFTATQGGNNPSAQSITFTASGSCSWPVNWQASITSHARWLTLSALSGSITTGGQSITLSARVNVGNLPPGTYTTQVSIAASDSTPTPAQGSPQVFSVTLTVLQACQLQASTNNLTFSTPTGQVSTAQSVIIQEIGNCVRPVSWTATGDSKSSAWLVFSPPSGRDNGAGATLTVNVNANALAPNTYSGTITLAASGAGSALVQGSPLNISISAVVTGVSVSGTVNACAASVCPSPVPLPGATVTLLNSGGATVASAVTGTTGTYKLMNVPLGTYTVSVAGADASGVNYVGTVSVTVTGNMSGINVTVLPG